MTHHDHAAWLQDQVSLIDLVKTPDFVGIQQQLAELLKALQDKSVDLAGIVVADMMAHRHPDSERFTACSLPPGRAQ